MLAFLLVLIIESKKVFGKVLYEFPHLSLAVPLLGDNIFLEVLVRNLPLLHLLKFLLV